MPMVGQKGGCSEEMEGRREAREGVQKGGCLGGKVGRFLPRVGRPEALEVGQKARQVGRLVESVGRLVESVGRKAGHLAGR